MRGDGILVAEKVGLFIAELVCSGNFAEHLDLQRFVDVFDDVHVVWALARFFGVRRTIGQLLRGLVLETEIPAPKRSQILVAHCATDERQRGTGVFTATGALPDDGSRDIVLDVLTRNERARALYERLGFAALTRRRARARRLPAELDSVRMRLTRRG